MSREHNLFFVLVCCLYYCLVGAAVVLDRGFQACVLCPAAVGLVVVDEAIGVVGLGSH